MNNPLVGGVSQMAATMKEVQQVMKEIEQFSRTINGSPQQQVQQLLNSGRVSQERYNWAYQQARETQKQIQQFQQMLGGGKQS